MNELPIAISEIIKDINSVIITHTYGDHWDEVAAKNIPKSLPIFVQNKSDKNLVQIQGFTNIIIVGENTKFKDINIIKKEGKHGTDDVIKHFGEDLGICMGFALKAPEEKTVYFTGDTIWTKNCELAIEKK